MAPISTLQFVRAILSFLEDDRNAFIRWVLIISVVFFHSLIPPLLVSKLVDFLTTYRQGESMTPLYALPAILGVSWAVASLLRLTAKQRLGGFAIEASSNCRVDGFEQLMARPLLWHGDEQAGSKVQRIQSGSASIQALISMLFNSVLAVAASIAGPLGAFLFSRIDLLGVALFYSAIFLWVQNRFMRRYRAAQELVTKARERAAGKMVEGASTVVTIKSLGAEDEVKGSIDTTEEELRDRQLHVRTLGTQMWQSFQLINGLFLGLFTFYLGRETLAGALSPGSVFLYFTYFYQLTGALGEISNLSTQVSEHRINIERMLPLFEERLKGGPPGKPFPVEWTELGLRDASFRYGESGGGIRSLDLVIPRGSRFGFVGASGSGKSTLAKILVGVYPLSSGSYTVGALPVSELKPKALREKISIVLQEPELLNVSLRENITLLRGVAPEVLTRAISVAQLEPVIARLPDGLDTILGEKGHRLSGGERQRVGIARALCRAPEVLILDEATSALDPDTEALVITEIFRAFPGLTVVSIAHRHRTLRFCERIFVLDQGRVVRSGAYEDVLASA